MQSLSEEEIKDQYELYNRLKNDIRKELLLYLYRQSKNYKELAEYSGLKPGSLYHHLGVLEPLVEKIGHGQYQITEMGKKIVESLDMISSEMKKPQIRSIKSDHDENNKNSIQKPKVSSQPTKLSGDDMRSKTKETNQYFDLVDKEELPQDSLLLYLWLHPSIYVLIVLSLAVIYILGLQGVAFAGSAIYAVGETNAFLVDILAIILGICSLFFLEDLLQKYPIYDRLKFITIIRLISMIPSLIIGITLLLLFSTGVIPPQSIYPFIFLIGIVMGTITMATGVHYLRAQSFSYAILYSIVPSFIDLLIGVVILLSV